MSAILAQILSEAEVSVARNSFKKQQNPPYIVYVFSHSNNFSADSKVYIKRENYRVELYTDKKDVALEEKLEGIFDKYGLVYDKTETYLESEKLIEVMYEIQLIGGKSYA
ncbi:MAG: hypothetical protein HN948_10475 [Clostridia bacterium]|jgi:hypothetical protein|nr:hypothetical protein [Clostridia bacterium]MBT7123420.1 hypothetical protein [Clostridia bacterium]